MLHVRAKFSSRGRISTVMMGNGLAMDYSRDVDTIGVGYISLRR